MSPPKAATVNDYIKAAPPVAQKHLREMRAILQEVAPKAEETLKWGNPVFIEKRILFAYAAYKTHMNFMPTPAAVRHFQRELEAYVTGMGSVQFPYDTPLPKALIREIATFRVKDVRENDARWM